LSPRGILVTALLLVGVGVTLVSCLGVLAMRDAYDRLHYTAPAAVVAPLAIAAAVVLEERFSAAGIKAVLVALVLILTNPVLGHATARAARIRQFGEWTVRGDEAEEGERHQ
jgi:monovalent cation/proton antiporter MnhG/PhaG subunit